MFPLCRMGVVTALAVMLGAAPSASAGPATDQLRGFFAEASRVREDPTTEGKLAERLTAIRRLVHQAFDFRGAAELALGPAWVARTDGEQDEFSRLFAALLERAYILGIARRTGADGPVKINYLGESTDGDWITVNTTVVSRDGGVTAYAYRMAERGAGWVVIDVVVDGLSVVANYRSQFVRILQTASFTDLLRRMQAKVADASEIWTASIGDPLRPASALPLAAVAPSSARTATQTVELQPVTKSAAAEPKATPQPAPDPEPVAPAATAVPAVTPAPQVASVAPEALARPVRTVVAAMRSYWVQVGAFASLEAAKRLASRLHEWQLRAHTGPLTVPEDSPTTLPLSRVRVGPFPDRAQAEAALRDLRARGFTPFIAEHRN